MSTVIVFALGALATILFFDGIGSIVSMQHYERRQRFFRITVKAPANLDAKRYDLVSRIFAGICSVGAGCVVLYWIYEYLGTHF
jgi:hypothetical protein